MQPDESATGITWAIIGASKTCRLSRSELLELSIVNWILKRTIQWYSKQDTMVSFNNVRLEFSFAKMPPFFIFRPQRVNIWNMTCSVMRNSLASFYSTQLFWFYTQWGWFSNWTDTLSHAWLFISNVLFYTCSCKIRTLGLFIFYCSWIINCNGFMRWRLQWWYTNSARYG